MKKLLCPEMLFGCVEQLWSLTKYFTVFTIARDPKYHKMVEDISSISAKSTADSNGRIDHAWDEPFGTLKHMLSGEWHRNATCFVVQQTQNPQ